MGWKSRSIDKIFDSRINMVEYTFLTSEVKEVVDYTIINDLKQNPVLRLRKDIKPKYNSLFLLSWSDIIMLREALANNELENAICIVYKINKKQYLRLGIFNAYAAYLWIAHQFKDMMEKEIAELSFELDEAEKDAGAEDLQDLGYVVALDGLTGGDLLKYDDWLCLPYSKIFRKLVLDKKKYEINKNLQLNASRKHTTDS